MAEGSGDDRRQQILDAALQVFGTKGYRGATNREIAELVGVAPGLIYWYFKNKEDLFYAVLDAFAPFGRVHIPWANVVDAPPAEVLTQLLQHFARVLEDPRALLVLRILISETIPNPALGQRFNLLFKQLLDPLQGYLLSQIALGRLRAADPLLMAQSLLAPVGIFYIRLRIGQDRDLEAIDPNQLTQFAVNTFMQAFGMH